MTEASAQKNTAYGVFVQACWAQHKRQYPDELIHKEIEEFNKQCSVWWYNLSEQERDRFQEMADRSNAQQSVNQYGGNNIVTTVQGGVQQQMIVTNTAGGSTIPSFGSSFSGTGTDGTYYIQGGQQGQVLNAVVDNTGQVLNYSTNASGQTIVRQVGAGQVQHVQVGGQQKQVVASGNSKVNQKPIKDPNAPKKPLSAYFLFSQEERLKVKAENPDYSITEVAKELGKRWATLDPNIKNSYEQRYQESRRVYESEMNNYKPKKKKDPNAPKQPLSAYFIFSTEERLKVKESNPSFSICEVAKELGRRWAEMDPQVKQRYQQRAEEERQKYDNDMANYRQGNLANAAAAANTQPQQAVTTVVAAAPAADNHASSPAVTTAATYTAVPAVQGQDYSNLLQ